MIKSQGHAPTTFILLSGILTVLGHNTGNFAKAALPQDWLYALPVHLVFSKKELQDSILWVNFPLCLQKRSQPKRNFLGQLTETIKKG